MAIDLYWTMDGDITQGIDGDLRDTSFDPLRSLYQEIRTRVRSSYKDWALHPMLGANLKRLLGKVNNRTTAEEGKVSILAALSQHSFVPRSAVKIRYLPLSRHKLLYQIHVSVMDAITGKTQMLQTMYLYDTLEGRVAMI